MWPQDCPTPRKRAFDSKREAKIDRGNRRYNKPYLCRCGMWHTTKGRTAKKRGWRQTV